MKAIVTGSSGFIGSALVENLERDGHHVVRLVRTEVATNANDVFWDPLTGIANKSALEGAGAVFHLAGENLADGRWTKERKRRIRDSRVCGTRTLATALSGLESPPDVMVCSSAVGIYGRNLDEPVTESSPTGQDWLAQMCVEWESATDPAQDAGIRTVHMRTGIVLDPFGGMLKRILFPFRLGLGGRLGTGTQPMSWITLQDTIAAFRFAAETTSLSGPVNLCAPENSTNINFTVALGKALGRPTVLPVPSIMIKVIFGSELAAAMLGGVQMDAGKLLGSGFKFHDPYLAQACWRLLAFSR
jgi:uncharacterized protein (TIGR01777 family)